MRARALVASCLVAGIIGLAMTGCAATAEAAATAAAVTPAAVAAVAAPAGGTAGCATAAYTAIRAHQRLTAVPAVCRPLTPAERNTAAGLAIRMAAGPGPKSQRRRQAGTAARYVGALITGPAPIPPAAAGSSSGSGSGATSAQAGQRSSRLGFSERAAQLAALAAWLATAGSGGWILGRWWRAGGRPGRLLGQQRGRGRARQPDQAAPPVVIVGHVGLGLLGLAIWTLFLATGWAALAWASVGVLCPVAGLGMTVLLNGLPKPRPGLELRPQASVAAAAALGPTTGPPSPNGHVKPRGGIVTLAPAPPPAAPFPPATRSRRSARSARSARSRRQPVAVIAAHGLFVLATLLLVLLAAIGA